LEKSEKTNFPKLAHAQSKPQPLYGIVLYDFQAERSDELDAKAGEPIIIIAQSNAEWFVAKPIGRLGGPGLIPVSFVDIRDASTGRTVKNDLYQATNNSTAFPNVEDWKKQTQGYEASSISLGRIEKQMQHIAITEEEDVVDPVSDYYDVKDSPHPDAMLNNYGMTHLISTSSASLLEQGPIPNSRSASMVISAYIDSHILEGDQYWFIVFVKLANEKHRVLYRLYEGK
jgi:bud emergence protein 1